MFTYFFPGFGGMIGMCGGFIVAPKGNETDILISVMVGGGIGTVVGTIIGVCLDFGLVYALL